MAGYFSFHKMVSTSIIKVTYVIGLILITLWSFVAIGFGIYGAVNAARVEEPAVRLITAGEPMIAIIGGVVVLIFGNLLWRLLREGWILLFSMHELLAKIADGSAVAGHVGYERSIT